MKIMTAWNLFVFVFGAAGALFGIQGCNCEIQCSKALINIGYVGYDSVTLDTVIIRRFDKTSSGNKLKDTILLANPEHIRYRFKGDTAMLAGANLGTVPFFSLQSDWNYEVFIPAAGRTFYVSDILEEQSSREVPCYSPTMQKRTCMNIVYSINVDNRPALMNDYYNIFLSK